MKLKLSKTSWVLITIGVIIIPLVSLSLLHSQQLKQQNQLSEELALSQLKLNGFQLGQLSGQQGELEEKLSQTTSQLEATRRMLSQPNGGIATSNILFDIAEACDVAVTDISSSGLTIAELDGIPCSALPLTAKVEGDIPALVSFVTGLSNELTTSIVESLEIIIPEATSGDNSSANIQLVIYSYRGD